MKTMKLPILCATLTLSAILCACDSNLMGRQTSRPSKGTQAQLDCAALKAKFTVPISQQALCQTGGLIIHSNLRRTPSVVAEELSPARFDGSVARTDDFRPDTRLPEAARAELSDYKGSGYDRGHLAPAADASSDAAAMSASFLLSNIAPQNPGLNRDAWAGLEGATRACAASQAPLLVITGVTGSAGKIGRGVVVPAAFYKIWVQGNQARAWLMPNKNLGRLSGQQISRYEVNPADLQKFSGYTDSLKQGRFCAGALPLRRG